MKLDALCCESCRAKVAAIEARDANTASHWFTAEPPLPSEQCMRDRRELLTTVEGLLGTVAKQREIYNDLQAILNRSLIEQTEALIARADALKLRLAASSSRRTAAPAPGAE